MSPVLSRIRNRPVFYRMHRLRPLALQHLFNVPRLTMSCLFWYRDIGTVAKKPRAKKKYHRLFVTRSSCWMSIDRRPTVVVDVVVATAVNSRAWGLFFFDCVKATRKGGRGNLIYINFQKVDWPLRVYPASCRFPCDRSRFQRETVVGSSASTAHRISDCCSTASLGKIPVSANPPAMTVACWCLAVFLSIFKRKKNN